MIRGTAALEKGVIRVEIRFHSKAYCIDGYAGEVEYVFINRRSWKVTHMIIKEDGRESDDWIVPLRFLETSAPDAVRLNCTLAQVRGLPHFTLLGLPARNLYETAGELVGTDTYSVLEASLRQAYELNVPPGYDFLYWGTQVGTADRQVGRLNAVRFEPKHHMLSALVIQQRFLWMKKAYAIPSRNIAEIEPEIVTLHADLTGVEALPAMPPRRS